MLMLLSKLHFMCLPGDLPHAKCLPPASQWLAMSHSVANSHIIFV